MEKYPLFGLPLPTHQFLPDLIKQNICHHRLPPFPLASYISIRFVKPKKHHVELFVLSLQAYTIHLLHKSISMSQ